jgi:hypothetical protein
VIKITPAATGPDGKTAEERDLESRIEALKQKWERTPARDRWKVEQECAALKHRLKLIQDSRGRGK